MFSMTFVDFLPVFCISQSSPSPGWWRTSRRSCSSAGSTRTPRRNLQRWSWRRNTHCGPGARSHLTQRDITWPHLNVSHGAHRQPQSSPIHFPRWTTTSPSRLLLKRSTSCGRGPSSLNVSRLGEKKRITHVRPCDRRRVPVSDWSALGPVSAAGRGSPSVRQRFLHFRRIHRRAGAGRLSLCSRRDRDALQTLLKHTSHDH